MSETENMIYIRLGTRQYEQTGVKGMRGKASIGAPFQFYAISNLDHDCKGTAPFYSIESVVDGLLNMRELKPKTHEYNKIRKWVGEMPQSMKDRRTRVVQRAVLNSKKPGCKVGFGDVMYAFTGYYGESQTQNIDARSPEKAELECRV